MFDACLLYKVLHVDKFLVHLILSKNGGKSVILDFPFNISWCLVPDTLYNGRPAAKVNLLHLLCNANAFSCSVSHGADNIKGNNAVFPTQCSTTVVRIKVIFWSFWRGDNNIFVTDEKVTSV